MPGPASESKLPVILVIDDDLVSREVTATLLTMDGYTVNVEQSGDAALATFVSNPFRPDVILTDAHMEGVSGAELIEALRAVCPQAAIYLISGSQPTEAVIAAADGFLLKPFAMDALRALLAGRASESIASFVDADEPAICHETLAQLESMMSGRAVREIFAAAVSDLDTRIDKLEAAIARRDRDEIQRIGHAIKGGCGMAGAAKAARLGALLEAENSKNDNHFDNSRALLRDLQAATLQLHRILDSEFQA